MADGRLAGAVLAAATLLLVAVPAAPVDAHATAVAAWPAPGQLLVAAPDRVVVEFSNDVEPQVDVAVVGPDGAPITVGEPVVDGRYVTQRIEASGQVGGYTAAFHAVAVDLHPIIARIDYTVDPAGTATANPAGDPPGGLVTAAPVVAGETTSRRPGLLLLAGAVVLVGVAVLHLVSRRRVAARRRPASGSSV